jgi:hypothetical protein
MSKNLTATRAAEVAELEQTIENGTTRQKARARARLEAIDAGFEHNGRRRTASDEWLAALQLTDTDSDTDRGEAVLSAASAIRNVKSANIVDYLRFLLDSGAWRSFTYPDGSHYEFLEREFDYFCALIDLDPKIANEAAKVTGSNDVLVAMAEASLTPQHWKPHEDPTEHARNRSDRSKRRSVDTIVETYPQIGPWLEKFGLRALGGAHLHGSKTVRVGVAGGKSGPAARGARSWTVQVSGEADLASRIAEKLTKDGLAASVLVALNRDNTRNHRKSVK